MPFFSIEVAALSCTVYNFRHFHRKGLEGELILRNVVHHLNLADTVLCFLFTPSGNDDICDPNLNTDDVLQDKACKSHLGKTC